jgi:hypothetical protein
MFADEIGIGNKRAAEPLRHVGLGLLCAIESAHDHDGPPELPMKPAQIVVRLLLSFGVSLSATLTANVGLAYADDPCAGFAWDVRHERALFATEPQILTGGQTAGTLPTLVAERLYQVELSAQSEVKFSAPPERKRGDGAAYAGLVRLTVEAAGAYRISLDQPLWIDVIANGAVPAKDFQGRPGCNAPHKIVEFLLPARIPITLQFSGGRVSAVRVTVTRSPGETS